MPSFHRAEKDCSLTNGIPLTDSVTAYIYWLPQLQYEPFNSELWQIQRIPVVLDSTKAMPGQSCFYLFPLYLGYGATWIQTRYHWITQSCPSNLMGGNGN